MLGLKCALILGAVTFVSAIELGSQDVVFHLFTRLNRVQSQQLFANINMLMASNFNPALRTIITIHSNGETVAGNFNAFVVPVHLDAEDVNILAVDWSRGSQMYTQGLANAYQCGERIAEFINMLISLHYGAHNFRIVGTGLGAQIAGIAARKANGVIPHIFALDPALFGWTYNPNNLKPTDAGVVEVIHTTAGVLGYDYPLGDIDFYPNGGSQQNGCLGQTTCSHQLSYIFYAESIGQTLNQGNRFIGTKCESYEQAINSQCDGERDAIFGGTEVKQSVSGIYHFTTNFVPPFAQD